MKEGAPAPTTQAERTARLARVKAISRRVGFVGRVEYRHAVRDSGGAQFALGPAIEQDVLLVFAEAFQRDASGADFSLEAIIAHEPGHQLLCRHERLRPLLPGEISAVTEEVVASLLGALVVEGARDGETLVLKALAELTDHGVHPALAVRHIEELLQYLEAFL